MLLRVNVEHTHKPHPMTQGEIFNINNPIPVHGGGEASQRSKVPSENRNTGSLVHVLEEIMGIWTG
jgi:hypothetical protein